MAVTRTMGPMTVFGNMREDRVTVNFESGDSGTLGAFQSRLHWIDSVDVSFNGPANSDTYNGDLLVALNTDDYTDEDQPDAGWYQLVSFDNPGADYSVTLSFWGW